MTPAMCLAIAIYFEARGEPPEGQQAVAQVVINRRDDPGYPNDICGVIYEPSAFSFEARGLPENEAGEISYELAVDMLTGLTYDTKATHYHTIDIEPYWAEEYQKLEQVGAHQFYWNNTRYK